MGEQFDLYDAAGQPLGRTKERALVHRDGDWHRSVNLWIVRPDARLVLQERSPWKDTWPGRLTASVGGHYAAGERLAQVLREAEEEVGVPVGVADLIPLGVWRNDDAPAPGVLDRELQEVFLWPLGLPLAAFRPDVTEVTALVEVAAADLLRLMEGTTAEIAATSLRTGAGQLEGVRLRPDHFVPQAAYHAQIARAALAYGAGQPLPAFDRA